MRKSSIAALAAAATMAAGIVLAGAPAQADQQSVKVGVLTCNVSSGFGFIFGSSRALKCSYSPKQNVVENYVGHINKFGVDIGYLSNAVIIWAVFAPTTDLGAGALAGRYVGATADASIAIGLGANVLVGGSHQSLALQPLSIEGNQGLNVAAGIAEINLKLKQ